MIYLYLLLGLMFWMLFGAIAGANYDNMTDVHRKTHKKLTIHKKFLLFGIFSFFKKIRHKYICDKCL